jgi:hypothetical protein
MAKTNGTTAEPGFQAPQFDRLNYFYGQMLGACDFRTERSYFRDKMRLHNRCLHGYGTVCGLLVEARRPKPECAADAAEAMVVIEPGLALDVEGNELIVRDSDCLRVVDLWKALSDEDQQFVANEIGDDENACCSTPLFIYLHYTECPLGLSIPIAPNSCGGKLPNQYGKLRDIVRVSVSFTPPVADTRCETCCCEGPCACDGLVLARIDRFRPHCPVSSEDINNEVRRRIGIYPFTTITGINWRHGAHHRREFVRHLLKDGLVVHFSRPVLSETLGRGVVDIYHIESRSTRHPNIIELRGEIAPYHGRPTTELRYRIPHLEECPEPGDRVLVVVRSAFILDECCRPVDGLNVGGRVPYQPGERPHHEAPTLADPCEPCAVPPWGYAPWGSGNGTGGGTFESWFYVEEKYAHDKKIGGQDERD